MTLFVFASTVKSNEKSDYAMGEHLPSFFIHDYIDRIDYSDYNYYADYVNGIAMVTPGPSILLRIGRIWALIKKAFLEAVNLQIFPVVFMSLNTSMIAMTLR